MQLRPFVADDVAERLDFEWTTPDSLCSPVINVRLGIQYYKELMELFEGDVAKALTAYNYGPTMVNRQIRQGTYAHSAYAVAMLSRVRPRAARADRGCA
jgi:soluble lytic murein transglycosylase